MYFYVLLYLLGFIQIGALQSIEIETKRDKNAKYGYSNYIYVTPANIIVINARNSIRACLHAIFQQLD